MVWMANGCRRPQESTFKKKWNGHVSLLKCREAFTKLLVRYRVNCPRAGRAVGAASVEEPISLRFQWNRRDSPAHLFHDMLSGYSPSSVLLGYLVSRSAAVLTRVGCSDSHGECIDRVGGSISSSADRRRRCQNFNPLHHLYHPQAVVSRV